MKKKKKKLSVSLHTAGLLGQELLPNVYSYPQV